MQNQGGQQMGFSDIMAWGFESTNFDLENFENSPFNEQPTSVEETLDNDMHVPPEINEISTKDLEDVFGDEFYTKIEAEVLEDIQKEKKLTILNNVTLPAGNISLTHVNCMSNGPAQFPIAFPPVYGMADLTENIRLLSSPVVNVVETRQGPDPEPEVRSSSNERSSKDEHAGSSRRGRKRSRLTPEQKEAEKKRSKENRDKKKSEIEGLKVKNQELRAQLDEALQRIRELEESGKASKSSPNLLTVLLPGHG